MNMFEGRIRRTILHVCNKCGGTLQDSDLRYPAGDGKVNCLPCFFQLEKEAKEKYNADKNRPKPGDIPLLPPK